MRRRIPPSEVIRQRIEMAFGEGKGNDEHPLDPFVKDTALYMRQVAVAPKRGATARINVTLA